MANKSEKKLRLPYIILSIIASFILWLYVAYVDNPESTVNFYGVRVELTNEDLLRDNGLVVTNVDTQSLNIALTGRRNTVTRLSTADIKAVVDLTDILAMSTEAGEYQLDYEFEYSTNDTGIFVDSVSRQYITVTVESLATVTVPVRAIYNGGVAEGYISETPEASPSTIEVSGPKDVVSEISYAAAELDRANLSTSTSEQVELVLMDENDTEIPQDDLTLSSETVTVSVSVLMVKEVPLVVNFIEGASATDANIKYSIDPDVITISGDPAILEDYNQITLGTIDLKSFTFNTTETYPITLPNDVRNLTGSTTATVTVEVLNMSSRRLTASNIQYRNNTPGFNVDIVTQSMDVTIRGSEADIEQVTSDNIRIVADLSELGNTTGAFTVPATVYVDGFDSVDAVGEYTVTVIIS